MSAITEAAPPIARTAPVPRSAWWRRWFTNPWGRPRFLVVWTWLYIAWTIVPVLIAVQFSFNDGRSRSTFQGFSLQWYQGIFVPGSREYDPSLWFSLENSLKIAAVTVPVATLLGVGLALGLARWRGRGSGAANFLMLFPLVTPEIVMGVSLFLIFVNLYEFIPLGLPAMIVGHITFTLSYVVIVTRGRLFAIGKEYEEAAMDLGASSAEAIRRVLLPLLLPAVFAGAFIAFAISIDDFVISAFLCIENCTTIPIKIYSAARNAGNPGLNAIATLMMVGSLLAITLAVLVQRVAIRRHEGETRSAVEDFARLEI
ncbi:MAG: polyamine ABC transporter permease [Actinomycetota bacterium]|nr:MAG: polyamine ABC transporter permease [Actinomycetota bacterium]